MLFFHKNSISTKYLLEFEFIEPETCFSYIKYLATFDYINGTECKIDKENNVYVYTKWAWQKIENYKFCIDCIWKNSVLKAWKVCSLQVVRRIDPILNFYSNNKWFNYTNYIYYFMNENCHFAFITTLCYSTERNSNMFTSSINNNKWAVRLPFVTQKPDE